MGFTDFDIKKLVLALRVLYPNPEDLEHKTALNLLVNLANSPKSYKTFDEKSIFYIEQCLSIVENEFSGKNIKKINVPIDHKKGFKGGSKSIEIEYYDKIKTDDKIYNKSVVADPMWIKSYFLLKDNLKSSDISVDKAFDTSRISY